ncbi:MAG: hypothetical protein Q8O62_05995 [Aequorivita sp.]|nr:hypothetical protein [Aequorivita sp.]
MKEPELLWIDEKNLRREQIVLIKAEDNLNKFIKAAERVLGSLTNKQRELIRKEKIQYIEAELKKRFPFPNATVEFNYQSMGVDLNQLNNLLKAGTSWRQYDFDLGDDGHFTQSEEQRMFKQYYHYADTDRKNAALSFAKKIEALVAEAQEKGFVDHGLLPDVSNAFRGLVMIKGEPRREGSKLVVNHEGIAKYL